MRRRHQQVVDWLRSAPDGLTTKQLGDLMGMSAANAASYASLAKREAPIEYTIIWIDSPHATGPRRIRNYVWRLRADAAERAA